MTNSVIKEYEGKRWYRSLKSLYLFSFAIILILANSIVFDSFDFLTFIITNAVVVFSFGSIEGLFWYIARGKWGYPKDDEESKILDK